MKRRLYIATTILGLWSCANQATTKPGDTKDICVVEAVQTRSVEKLEEKIYIKDKSLYDSAFITNLSNYKEPIKLVDNCIFTGKDTVYFPEEIPLNRKMVFKGTREQKNFILTLTRTNLTSLIYDFRLADKDNNLLNTKTGKAILGLFFLGSESDEDDETGDSYLSSEYRDDSSDCSFSIRIGAPEDYKKLLANVNLHCKGNKSANIENSPTLRTE